MTRTASTPPTSVVWDPELLSHRFTDSHPMDPVRLDLTERLSRDLGIFDSKNVTLTAPGIADDDALATVHDRSYISAVTACSSSGDPSAEHGLGTDDVPVFADMHTSAARIAGGTLHLAQELLAGRIQRGVNFAGGMHHAARSRASGFCIYNDAAIAVQHLLDNGTQRVVYIDVDAHHGDGTQDIFYNDPRVMTISLHQSGVSIYPGTGFPNETGRGDAVGTSVNIALPATTGDAGFLRAFHSVVPALVRAFEPEVVVSQHGCDSHADDPLTDLTMTMDGLRQLALDVGHLADEFTEGRWIATGGGGYSIYHVVPRAWAHLTAIAAGAPLRLSTSVPSSWREYVSSTFGVSAPRTMNDDADLWWRTWELGYDPEDPVDRAIIQTRKEIFPLHGLDPWFD